METTSRNTTEQLLAILDRNLVTGAGSDQKFIGYNKGIETAKQIVWEHYLNSVK